ncbi:MAG: FkbM family methyltransferase [Tamlana sp.]
MRRLKILLYWIFTQKNNVIFTELIKFLVKPKREKIASKYIKSITKGDHYLVTFKNTSVKLFWPIEFDTNSIYQITAETFDPNDWHYYRKDKTEIEEGEVLLDIGTAEGLFPLVVAKKCKKIFLVEPSKLFVNCLKTTFEPFKHKVTIYNVAVGNIDGVIDFHEDSLSGKIGESQKENPSKTAIKRIDTLIPQDEKITYLKADIEGFEFEMLKGAENTIKRNKPKIAITTYHKENNAQEIINLILSYVPEYKYYEKGIFEIGPKPVMIHFWID